MSLKKKPARRKKWVIEEYLPHREVWKRTRILLHPEGPNGGCLIQELPHARAAMPIETALEQAIRLRDKYPSRTFRIRRHSTDEVILAAVLGERTKPLDLSGLGDDDQPQYFLNSGHSGQVVQGGVNTGHFQIRIKN